jgi:hypothetical protein
MSEQSEQARSTSVHVTMDLHGPIATISVQALFAPSRAHERSQNLASAPSPVCLQTGAARREEERRGEEEAAAGGRRKPEARWMRSRTFRPAYMVCPPTWIRPLCQLHRQISSRRAPSTRAYTRVGKHAAGISRASRSCLYLVIPNGDGRPSLIGFPPLVL